MGKKFVQEIKYIDALHDHIQKDELFKATWNKWKDENEVVRSVVEGKTTFENEYIKVFDFYNSWRVWLPYSVPEGFEKEVADLEKCVGYDVVSDSSVVALSYNNLLNKIYNPLGMGSAFFLTLGVLLGFASIIKKNINGDKFNRRDFFRKKLWIPIIGSIEGGIVGSIASGGTKLNLNTIKNDAIYLDKICREYILK